MRVLLILCCLSAFLGVRAQKSYEKEWKQIASFEKEGLPASVVSLSEKIYKEAEKGKNFPQQLRAFVTRMNARMSIDPDSFYTDITSLRQWKTVASDTVQQSVLAQISADKLMEYLQKDLYIIRQRSETSDLQEQDIRKWTPSQFRHELLSLNEQALASPRALSLVPTHTYQGLITLGKASRYFLHDMYHLSGFHSIEIIKRLQQANLLSSSEASCMQDTIYSEMIRFYRINGNRSAVFLLNTERLETKHANQELSDSLYRIHLESLIRENQDLDVVVEGSLKMATSLSNSGKYTEALRLIDQVSARYTRYDRINALKELRSSILQPLLSVDIPQIAYPGEKLEIKATHKNLSGFTLRFYLLSLEPEQKELDQYRDKTFLKEYGGTPFSRDFSLIPPEDYREKDTIFYVDAPAHGIYVIEAISTVKKDSHERGLLPVSSLKALLRKLPQSRQTDIVVLDRKTGFPVAGAELSVYMNQKGESIFQKTLTTDAKGECQWNEAQGNSFQIYVKRENDTSLPALYTYNYSNIFQSDDNSNEHIQLFTDRGIYRPGQTVFVKGIAYRKEGNHTEVLPSRNFDLVLLDANNKEISKATLRSNEWGSFTHEFTLPVRTLSGNFRIQSGKNSTYIRVEEYKRPTFEVRMDTLSTAFQIGDTVTITGTAHTFSGFPLQNDSVTYTIIREPRFLWRTLGAFTQTIASGTARTDAQGHFALNFRLEAPNPNSREELAFRFRIQVDVTESSGETQRGESTVTAGNRSLVLSCDLPTEICRDSVLTVTPRAENLNGVAIPAELEVQLFRKGEKYPLWHGTVTANSKRTIRELYEIPSGEYLVQLTARDNQNRLCKWEKEFTLFSVKDTRSPVRKPIWTKQIQTVFPENGPAEILFATAEKEVYLLYDVFANNELVKSWRLTLSDTLVHFQLPYKEEYGDGVSVTIGFVKDGKLHQEYFTIQKPAPATQLTLKWEVFRDKLQPGQKEEWHLQIKGPKGNPVQAELLASMYDASLDRIYPFHPDFPVNYSRNIQGSTWNTDNEYSPRMYVAFPFKPLNYPQWAYDKWSLETGYNALRGIIPVYGGATKNRSSMLIQPVPMAMKVQTDATGRLMVSDELQENAVMSSAETVSESPVTIRENFNETAFFYPQLYTDENGEITISFTLPESLTKWQFTGIAHTKEVHTGRLQSEITASKPFMLTANLPRYLRQGDEIGIAASIRNYSGIPIQGTVRCEIFDPYSDKIIKKLQQPFHIESDSTHAVFFELELGKGYELIGIRMIADGGTFSDGEQHVLALLSDKVHLVESIPLSQRGNGSKEYSLAPLFNQHSATASDRKITVEITANPSWLAVQALPYLNNASGDNALTYAIAYYANTLFEWIVQQNPTLKTALEVWKATPSPTSSNLQRNSELKELLLEETPWVAQAESEAERRARLVTLTDENTLQYQRMEALEKLKSLQWADGSFPWFPGMRGSTSITAFIVELLGRIPLLTAQAEDPLSVSIRQNAYEYLHKTMMENYNQIPDKNTYKLSESELNYLYLCTLNPGKIPAASQTAYNFYLKRLPQSLSSLSLRGRATAVQVLLYANQKEEAARFYRSLKEHTVTSGEMGQFFANTGLADGTSTLTRAIEAAWAMNDVEFADEMKLHLLRQKQTQMWNSSVSTSNAVYALLKGNTNLSPDSGESTVVLGDQIIRSQPHGGDADALMGYTKVSFTGNDTQAEKATFTYTGNGISWGAIYGESNEQIKQVKEQGEQVKVLKEMFVRRQTSRPENGGISWEKITKQTLLHRGDQVMTRLTVIADREMNFVTLKDQRAACLEPVRALSDYRSGGYFVSEKDASSNLFFDRLPKGSHQFEIESYVTRSGTYHSGIATLQSAYSTEFSGHSASQPLTVQ